MASAASLRPPNRYNLFPRMFGQMADLDPFDESDSPDEDGRTETETIVVCPHCGEENAVALDPGGGSTQEYVEDCQVCCRPWRVTVRYGSDGRAEVVAEPLVE